MGQEAPEAWEAAAAAWSAAVDLQIAALGNWRDQRGQKGEEMAKLDYRRAVRKQEKALERLEKLTRKGKPAATSVEQA